MVEFTLSSPEIEGDKKVYRITVGDAPRALHLLYYLLRGCLETAEKPPFSALVSYHNHDNDASGYVQVQVEAAVDGGKDFGAFFAEHKAEWEQAIENRIEEDSRPEKDRWLSRLTGGAAPKAVRGG